jgi:hypothetical protein
MAYIDISLEVENYIKENKIKLKKRTQKNRKRHSLKK